MIVFVSIQSLNIFLQSHPVSNFALKYFSLDQLLVSTLDQQKLQSILSSVTTKCDVSSLLQEAKAQAEVSLDRIKMETGQYLHVTCIKDC